MVKQGSGIVTHTGCMFFVTEIRGETALVGCVGQAFKVGELRPAPRPHFPADTWLASPTALDIAYIRAGERTLDDE